MCWEGTPHGIDSGALSEDSGESGRGRGTVNCMIIGSSAVVSS